MKAAAALLGACLVCASAGAIAQNAAEVPLGTEALRYADGDAVQGCGIRLTGGEPRAKGSSSWFDVSFNVYRRGIVIVQAIGYEIPQAQYDTESRPERVAMQRAWLKAEAAGGITRIGENIAVRDSVIYTVTVDEAASLFAAVAKGQRLAVGIKRWGQAQETVYIGALSLDDSTRRQIRACLEALLLSAPYGRAQPAAKATPTPASRGSKLIAGPAKERRSSRQRRRRTPCADAERALLKVAARTLCFLRNAQSFMGFLAERVGFEPTIRLRVFRFSRPARSTTLAPLRCDYGFWSSANFTSAKMNAPSAALLPGWPGFTASALSSIGYA